MFLILKRKQDLFVLVSSESPTNNFVMGAQGRIQDFEMGGEFL